MEVAELEKPPILTTDQFIQTTLTKFNMPDEALTILKTNYLALKINGIADKEGYKKVYDARQIVKRHRITIEEKRKELKVVGMAYNKAVDDEAKRLSNIVSDIETHLETQEVAIDNAKQKIKDDEKSAENARIQTRIDSLAQYNFALDYAEIRILNDESFRIVLESAKDRFDKQAVIDAQAAEEKRLAEEKAEQDRIAEVKRLADQKAAQDAEAARLKLISDKIEADQKALREAQEKLVRDQIEQENKAKQEAQDKIDAENKRIADEQKKIADQKLKDDQIAKEKLEKEAVDKKALEDEQMKAELAPDKEKIEKYVVQLRAEMPKYPNLTTPQAQDVLNNFKTNFRVAALRLIDECKAL